MGYLNIDSTLRISLYRCQKQTATLSTVSALHTHSAISQVFEGFCRRSEEPVKHEERVSHFFKGEATAVCHVKCASLAYSRIVENTESAKRIQETTHRIDNIFFVYRSHMLGDHVLQF